MAKTLKYLKTCITLCLSSFIIFGCAAPLHMNLTYNLPKGEGWKKVFSKENGVMFNKVITKGNDHLISVTAIVIGTRDKLLNISDLLTHVENDIGYKNDSRFRVLEFKSSIINYKSRDCVKVDYIVEDHGESLDAAPSTFTIIKGYQYSWFVPYNSGFIVRTAYSDRFLSEGHPLEGIEEEVEPFIKSIMVVSKRSNKETPSGIEQLETDEFIFSYPQGFKEVRREQIPEESVILLFGKEGNSINVSRFDYLSGKELDEKLCNELVAKFNQSELRTVIDASEAIGVSSMSTDKVKSCYYKYKYTIKGSTSILEYKVFQKGISTSYAVTIIYNEHFPEKESLQRAINLFQIKD